MTVLVTTINFIFFYFNFWASFAVVVVGQICIAVTRQFLFDEGPQIFNFIANVSWLLVSLWPVHVLIQRTI